MPRGLSATAPEALIFAVLVASCAPLLPLVRVVIISVFIVRTA
jgi:hypothetical protein